MQPSYIKNYLSVIDEFIKVHDKVMEELQKEPKHICDQVDNQLYNLGIEIANTVICVRDVFREEAVEEGVVAAE